MFASQTWAQPPGYVHIMNKQAFAYNMLNITSPTMSQAALNQAASASLSDDKATLVLRLVNFNPVSTVRCFQYS